MTNLKRATYFFIKPTNSIYLTKIVSFKDVLCTAKNSMLPSINYKFLNKTYVFAKIHSQ